LYDLSPRKFEELVADILKDFGFDVSLTPSTRDGGKDILAYMRKQICSYLMFVECKRWKPDQHVGIEIVQRLYGVQQANNANKSMVVTTSFFSKSAIEESKRYEYMMALKDSGLRHC
jgi:restriction endonuclease Mrr